ncbi:MAG: hypothetical protein NZ841_02855 [Dictyoglomus sp.]|nr:hypothetical protein [Dictyoglomus sp.]MDW8188217.1 enolase C-terminal domain-like protein [Dictyoglomus sp.]
MDIVDLKVIPREYKYKEPFRIATGVRDQELNLEIEITLKDGTKGVGEASSVMISYLFSKDSFFQLEKTLRDILKILYFLPSVMAGAEYAIISALCNLKDILPYIFFGGEKEVIKSDRSKDLDLEEDLRKVIEIQKTLPLTRFIVDANQSFDVKSAIIFAKELYKEGVKVEIFEQPVLKKDIEGLKLVRFYSLFPIAGDESVYRLIELVRAGNKGLMIGCMGESSLGISQSVHFTTGTGVSSYCDLDSHLLIEEEGFRGSFIQEGEKIKVN